MRLPTSLARLQPAFARHRLLNWAALALLFAAAAPAGPQAPAVSENRITPIVLAVEKVKAATVNIHTEKRAPQSETLFSSSGDRKINGMGTGVILDERGYILTNYHVVNGVDSLRVSLLDGSSYVARVVSFDSKADLALIKIDPVDRLQVITTGTSSDLMLGEDVLAIGNAFGYEHTVTRGIISALSRDVEVNEEQGYENLIQIDAAINPGNSGGPLLNRDGEVIGINVAIRAGAQKIGFAIPIDEARKVAARLLDIERLDHNYHGLEAQDFKRGPQRELIVSTTAPGSPAAAAGLQQGDVITRVGTTPVVDMADFQRALLGRAAGETVDVVIQRGDEKQTLALALAALDAPPQVAHRTASLSSSTIIAPQPDEERTKSWTLLGVRLQALSARERSLVGPRYRGGLKVVSVRHEGPAERHGIREGDILVGLHVWETITPDNVDFVVNHPQLSKFNPLKFYVLRGSETLYGYLQLQTGR